MKTVPKASVTKLVRGIAELKASDRMFRLKKIILEEPRYVDITQALLVTASYKKTEGRPKIIQRALAFGHVIDNLPLRIYEGELIVGNRTYGSRWGVVSPEAGISWLEKEIDTIDTRPQDPFTFRDEDKKRFREEIVHYWKGKSLEDRIMEEHGTEIKAISKVVKVNQLDHAQGHIIADVPLWLKLGIVGMEDRVKRAMAGKSSESQPGLYESMLISLDAARRFMLRYAHYAENLAGMETDEHRAAELREIGRICAKISNDPPSTFHEALQSIWFLFVLLDTESNASSFSFGRMDQYLYRFFIADIESGALSLDFARDLLESFWLCCNKIVYMRNREGARYFAGFPIGFNIVIGGQLADGSDGTNALSYLCLKAQDHLRLPQPNLSVRLYEKSPEEFVDACSRVIGGGGGMPQIFSDTSIIPALEKQGISHTDAVNYAVVGCVELSCSGNYLGWSDAAEADSESLRADIDRFVDEYHGVPLKQLDFGAMLGDVVGILREHGLALPPDLALMIKAFITLEGLGRQLDPDFDIAGEAAPYLREVILAHHAPDAIAKRGWRGLVSVADLLAGLPHDLARLLRIARRGSLKLEVDVPPLKAFGDQLDRAASRLTMGIVTAALIVGSSIALTVNRSDSVSLIGLLGFVGAMLGGLWVLVSVWRGGR